MAVCAVHVEKSCGVELCGMERERVVRKWAAPLLDSSEGSWCVGGDVQPLK